MYICINLLFQGNDRNDIEVAVHVSYNAYIYKIGNNHLQKCNKLCIFHTAT